MRNFNARAGLEIREEWTDRLQEFGHLIEAASVAAVRAGGEIIRVQAYENANVSPGIIGNAVDGSHMRDNIRVEIIHHPHDVQAKVGIDISIVPYAPHQEFGPHGNAFMRRAVDETRPRVHQVMAETFREVAFPERIQAGTSVRFRRFA